jgi:hypothetical protein
MCLSELIWMRPPERPFIQKVLVKCLPRVRSVGRLVNTPPPATGCRSPLADQRPSELRSRSARPPSRRTIRWSVSSR